MVPKLKLRLGVADDPTALQPSLNDCLAAVIQQSEPLFMTVLEGLEQGAAATGGRRIQGFQRAGVKEAIAYLNHESPTVAASFVVELTRLVYEGGGKEERATEPLRFQDLELFEDEQLDQSIEL